MNRRRILIMILAVYALLAATLSLLAVKPAFYGLSTVMGTTMMGTTMMGTTMMGTTMMGTTMMGTTMMGTTMIGTGLKSVYNEVSVMGQLAISLIAISMFTYFELSDTSIFESSRLNKELRKTWRPILAVFVVLFVLVVFFRMLGSIA